MDKATMLKSGKLTLPGTWSTRESFTLSTLAAGGANAPAYWAPASLIRPTPKKTPVA